MLAHPFAGQLNIALAQRIDNLPVPFDTPLSKITGQQCPVMQEQHPNLGIQGFPGR